MKNPRVALYFRVSTLDQNFASQKNAVRAYATRRGWPRLTAYEEKAGREISTRPVLAKLMTDARAGKIDAVLVYSADRFGTSSENFRQLLHELDILKIAFVSATEPIDTSDENPGAHLVRDVMFAMSKFTRNQLGDRIRSGLAAAKKRGAQLGRPRTVEHKSAEILRLAKTKSVAQIVKLTGIKKTMVYEVIKQAKTT